MGRWKLWALVAWLAASAGGAVAQAPADAVVQQLREQGYVDFEVSWTLLGRIRVLALAPDGEQREIVFNPTTGEILRDYSEATGGGGTPRILDRPASSGGASAARSPSGGGSPDDSAQPDGDDGNRGHGNDEDGSDSGNPGRGHGNDGTPGGGNSDHSNGQGGNPSRGGGNGAGD